MFVAKNQSMVYWITAAIVVVTIIKAIAEYVADVTVAYLGHRFIADLRIEMFARLARADLSFIQTVHSGRLLSSFLNDANLLRGTASRSIITLGENYLKVIILIGTMFYMDPRFAVLILLFMPFAWFMLSSQRRKMRKSTTKSLQETGDLSALITQTLRGMRIVRAYRQEDREEARAKSATPRRQRPPSEWSVLGRYLRQMTGHDLDAYARQVAVLKDRFARLDAREIWDRLRLEEGCIRLEMDRRGYDPAEEYEARRYGPNHLAHEIMMQ